jgi:peroxiredoxin
MQQTSNDEFVGTRNGASVIDDQTMSAPQSDADLTAKPRRDITPLLILALFPLLGLIAALALLLTQAQTVNNTLATPAAVTLPAMPTRPQLSGQPAPNFTLRTLDETTVSLSDYRGRIVFVNFWATWCEPCKRELPAFQAFQAAQGEEGAIILAVNTGETYDQAKTYLDEMGISGFPVLLDVRYEAADQYGAVQIPVTFVIDAEGTIRYTKFGEMKPEDLAAYVEALQGT